LFLKDLTHTNPSLPIEGIPKHCSPTHLFLKTDKENMCTRLKGGKIIGVGNGKWISGLKTPAGLPICFDLNSRKGGYKPRKVGDKGGVKIKIDFKRRVHSVESGKKSRNKNRHKSRG
jgi:hypothetical protein